MIDAGYQDLGDGYWLDPTDNTVWDPTVNQWVSQIDTTGTDAAASATDQSQVTNLLSQATNQGWSAGQLTQTLLGLGYTAAQLASLYQNVKISGQATPQMLQLLGQENAALQQNTQGSNTTWMLIGAGLIAVFLLTDRRAA